MSQHTPGPWTIHMVERGGHKCIQIIGERDDRDILVASTGSMIDMDWDNARLIAAAPELLEACESLLVLLKPEMLDGSPMASNVAAINAARAAVAKTLGITSDSPSPPPP